MTGDAPVFAERRTSAEQYFLQKNCSQVDTFTISGDYQAGDAVDFKVDGRLFTYTVTTADVPVHLVLH